MKLKINIWTGIIDIANCILFAFSWIAIFASAFGDAFNKTNNTGSTAAFFYFFAAVGMILNIISLIQNRRYSISLVGPILGLVGNILFLLGAIMAFPSIVLLIVATVFTFLQKPTSNQLNQSYQNNNYNQNYSRNNSGFQNSNNNLNNQMPMTRSARHHR